MRSNQVFRSLASLVAVAFMAATAVADRISTVRDVVVASVRAAGAWLVDRASAAVQLFEPPKDWRTVNRAAVAFVSARAFVLRLAKRERPVLTAAWRMCPST